MDIMVLAIMSTLTIKHLMVLLLVVNCIKRIFHTLKLKLPIVIMKIYLIVSIMKISMLHILIVLQKTSLQRQKVESYIIKI